MDESSFIWVCGFCVSVALGTFYYVLFLGWDPFPGWDHRISNRSFSFVKLIVPFIVLWLGFWSIINDFVAGTGVIFAGVLAGIIGTWLLVHLMLWLVLRLWFRLAIFIFLLGGIIGSTLSYFQDNTASVWWIAVVLSILSIFLFWFFKGQYDRALNQRSGASSASRFDKICWQFAQCETSSDDALIRELQTLEERYKGSCLSPKLGSYQRNACVTIRSQLDRIWEGLLLPGLEHPNSASRPMQTRRRLFAHEELELWKRLHRCQEELVLVDATEAVIEKASINSLRLASSKMGGRNPLLKQAKEALDILIATGPTRNGADTQQVEDEQERENKARLELRTVRRAINEFREARQEGIIRARDDMLETAITVLGAVSVLLIFGFASGVSRDTIQATIIFFFFGAIIALFKRLTSDSTPTLSLEEDYGLSRVRLWAYTPLVSGLAAIGGVILFAAMPSIFARLTGSQQTGSGLQELFNLDNPLAFLGAAVFGLAPTLLPATLEKYIERISGELDSTEISSSTELGVERAASARKSRVQRNK